MRCYLITYHHVAQLLELEAKGCWAWLSLHGTSGGMVLPELQPGPC